jgi:hypothetical protein
LVHHAPPAQNVLRFRGYNEARTTSENFIDCALLTKVKTLTFSNEFISSMRTVRVHADSGYRVAE